MGKYTLDFDADALKYQLNAPLNTGHYWRIGQVIDYDGLPIWDVSIIDASGNQVIRAGTKFDLPTFMHDTWEAYTKQCHPCASGDGGDEE
jgi:hypothetical protein